MTRVFYHSQTGNTKKVAEAMAGAIGCQAESLESCRSPVAADILFLGAAIYATHDHDLNPAVREFIERLEPAKVGRAVLFCTGFSEAAADTMRSLLGKKGIAVDRSTFYCKGKLFGILNFGHPNGADLEAARKFAKSIAKA